MSNTRSPLDLALTRWEQGQILQPEHFRAQEKALLGSTIETARLAGLPFWGVGGLEWNPDELAAGIVHITQLTIVFGPGQLVSVPSNARIESLDIKKVVAKDRASLCVQLVAERGRTTEVALQHQHAPRVARELYHLELSVAEVVDDQAFMLKLAELELQKGKWRLARTYVPPLLQVGTSPFLKELFEEIDVAARKLYKRLDAYLVDEFFRGETTAIARRCQLGAYRLLTILADHKAGVCRHPYFYIEALRSFYLDLCLLGSAEPADPEPIPYDHENLAALFNRLGVLIKGFGVPATVASPRVRFRKDGDRLLTEPFPPELKSAEEVYFVVLRADTAAAPISLEGVKLASPKRLEGVHTRSTSGVRFTPVAPSFQHSFGARASFYALHLGEEWSHARSEGALAYYARPELEGAKIALFWRTP